MTETGSDAVSKVLGGAIESLDIPDELFRAAATEYGLAGDWLAAHADGGEGWEVYPQGSFSLGTVVQPIGHDEYDIDLVCLRSLDKAQVTQEELKAGVGEALSAYLESRSGDAGSPDSYEEKKRCFTLNYEHSFHLDILPSIPDEEAPPTGILLTDRDLHRWQFSNPKAYAAWFRAQMRQEFVAKRMLLAEAAHVEPEEVPEMVVKTTLQRTVQALKHHRNVYFADDLDSRPSSILLSTLAAQVYEGEQDLFDAVAGAATKIPGLVKGEHTTWSVPNPVQERENFADKWNDYPDRPKKFERWLTCLLEDLEAARQEKRLDRVAARLSEGFGQDPLERAMERLELSSDTRSSSATGKSAGGIPVLEAGEQDLERDYGLPIEIRERVLINGEVVAKDGFRARPIRDRKPIEKRRSLRFTMVHTTVSPPFDVYWKVKNRGREAEAAGALRGEITRDHRGAEATKTESTLYTGDHYVEAYVVKSGVCVARTRLAVVVR